MSLPPSLNTHGQHTRGLARGRWLASAALVLGLGLGCQPAPVPPEPEARAAVAKAPVLIVSIDTLRSDHLPVYGYAGGETPAIDRLAADGILFERAFAHAPVTLPSHVSLLSGTLPTRHGIRDNPGYRVPGDIEWLPASLAAAGYATGAAVSASVLAAATGMDRGFERYDDGAGDPTARARSAEETTTAALSWLDATDNENWFLFVHFYEPHQPYSPAEAFAHLEPYDGEIATADAALGRLFAGLEERGLYDGSLIILTSDHGEGLGEHGERDHGVFVYRESLQVPLIVKLPAQRRAGDRVSAPVQLIDVVPTVTETVLGDESSEREGHSLLSDAGERQIYVESYLPRLYYGASELRSLIGPRFQYIESPEPELFDLIADPGGSRNLIATERERVARYREQIAQMTAALAPPDEVDDETLRQLAALGYLGGAEATTADDLPAPSSQIQLLETVGAAYDAIAAERWQEAQQGFAKAVELNPKAAFAWAQLGRAEQALGRDRQALDAWLRALELTDYAPFRLIPAARLAIRLERYELAEDFATRALAWSPAPSRGLLTRLALLREDMDTAKRWAIEALDADSKWSPPALQVLDAQLRAGAADDALIFAQAVEARISETPIALNMMIGEALVQVSRYEEAVERIEREITLYPERPRAYGYLATLHGKLDQAEQAGSAIDRLLRNVPGPARYVTAVQALAQLGFPEDAIALLQQGLAQYPQNRELQQLMSLARPSG